MVCYVRFDRAALGLPGRPFHEGVATNGSDLRLSVRRLSAR